MGINFVAATNITPGVAGSWQTVDVSAYCPAGATGITFHLVDSSANALNAFGIRKYGSTDNRTNFVRAYAYADPKGGHIWGSMGISSDRKVQIYVANLSVQTVYLTGYWDSDAVFFDNATNISLGTYGSYQDINISSYVSADAIGAIIEIITTETRHFHLRKNGSTDNRSGVAGVNQHSFYIVGIDANKILEGYIEYTPVKFYLVGYVKGGVVFNTNAQDITNGTTINTWYDLIQLPEGAVGALVEPYWNQPQKAYGLRKKGDSEDIHYCYQYNSIAPIEADASRYIQGYKGISDAIGIKFFLTGYLTAAPPPAGGKHLIDGFESPLLNGALVR